MANSCSTEALVGRSRGSQQSGNLCPSHPCQSHYPFPSRLPVPSSKPSRPSHSQQLEQLCLGVPLQPPGPCHGTQLREGLGGQLLGEIRRGGAHLCHLRCSGGGSSSEEGGGGRAGMYTREEGNG